MNLSNTYLSCIEISNDEIIEKGTIMDDSKRENYNVRDVIYTDARFEGLKNYLLSGQAVLSAPMREPIQPIPQDRRDMLLKILQENSSKK